MARKKKQLPETLNLGCGSNVLLEAHNVDVRAGADVDEVVDLNALPWPWADGMFREILALDVLEHLEDLVLAVNECWRVLRPHGMMVVRGPHYLGENWCADPTHKRAFNERSFEYLDPSRFLGQTLDYLTPHKWRVLDVQRAAANVVFKLQKIGGD